MAVKDEKAFEGIALKVDGKDCGTYQGLGGTFASFVYGCVDKKALAGFHEKGLIAASELKGATLSLTLAGSYTRPKLATMMDIALQNIGAFPYEGVKADFYIGVKSQPKTKKGR